MEKLNLTPAQKEVYDKLASGGTLVHLKASSSRNSWFTVQSELGEQSIDQRTGKSLISSGLLTESERKVISEHRVKIFYNAALNPTD